MPRTEVSASQNSRFTVAPLFRWNYRYNLAEVDDNHERYLSDGHIAVARRVQRLLA